MRCVWVSFLLLLALAAAQPRAAAQTADLLLGDEAFHLVDRIDIRGRTDRHIPTDWKPYSYREVAEWLADADSNRYLPPAERAWLQRVRWRVDDRYADTAGLGLWNTFFRNGRDFFHHQDDNFRIFLNPVFYGRFGVQEQNYRPGASGTTYLNKRGASLRGSLFDKVGFYADFTDNQARFPQYYSSLIGPRQSIPGEGFYKRFETDGYDYLTTRGYITYSPARAFRIKFGRDRAFVGNGYQSLQLSDHAVDYLLLNLRTRIWKLEYVNHFTQLIDYIPNKLDRLGQQPRKYGAFHALYYRPTSDLSLGVFESVVYAARLPNATRRFELQYLNPLIFYRSIEQYIGSPDNATMGLSAKANLFDRVQLYGQFLLDDYNFSRRDEGSGYWGNKFGFQAGLKWIDVLGIPLLDLQLEANQVRPYTYTHTNASANYAHYNQPLAHPLGANLREGVGILRYRPHHRLNLVATASAVQIGYDPQPDTTALNFGQDIFKPSGSHNNGTADRDFGNTVAQGEAHLILKGHLRLSYQLRRLPLWVDAEAYVRRDEDLENLGGMLGLRWAIPYTQRRF